MTAHFDEMARAFERLAESVGEVGTNLGRALYPVQHPNEAWLDAELARVLR